MLAKIKAHVSNINPEDNPVMINAQEYKTIDINRTLYPPKRIAIEAAGKARITLALLSKPVSNPILLNSMPRSFCIKGSNNGRLARNPSLRICRRLSRIILSIP